jgi:uncharacterized protein
MRVITRSGWMVLLGAITIGAADRGTAIVDAVKIGDSVAVRRLLALREDVNAPTADGTTALHWAVRRDDFATVDLLLAAGAKVDATNRYGVTPLWLACVNGDAAIIKKLMAAGADPNTSMPEGDTALMTAARTGQVEAVKALLAYGADVNAKEGTKDQTALMWAAAENNAAVVELLIEAGASLTARSRGGTAEDAKEGGLTPFLFAVRENARDAAGLLLARGADVDDATLDGASALHVAVASGHFDLAAWLLDHGANAKANGLGWTALHELAWIRRPQIGYNNPAHLPSGTVDSLELAEKLVARGADVNAPMIKEPGNYYNMGQQDQSLLGNTPIFLAARSADVPYIRFLVAHGADPHRKNKDETTPLMAAAGVGMFAPGDNAGTDDEVTKAVEIFLELGAAATDQDLQGNTALHGAAYRGVNGAVELLVAAGARLDVRNKPKSKRYGAFLNEKEGDFTPWRIAEGVYVNGAGRQQPHTATLLRHMLEARGLKVE